MVIFLDNFKCYKYSPFFFTNLTLQLKLYLAQTCYYLLFVSTSREKKGKKNVIRHTGYKYYPTTIQILSVKILS